MEINHEQTSYNTSDFPLVVTLSVWHPIESIDKSNPRRAVFCFQNTDELQKHLEEYWHGKILVEPRIFFDQIKVVKARLYEGGAKI